MSDLSNKNIDFLIIVPPAKKIHGVYPPYGAMYIASALREKKYIPYILNMETEKFSNDEIINRIRDINPKYIGFSGIVATSYKYIKDLSSKLKDAFPEKIQILGGGLSSAPDPVMKNTNIDIIVRGEGDITVKELTECLDKKGDLREVKGIYFRTKNSYEFTGDRELIRNLDILPYPFDLMDMNEYLPRGIDFINSFPIKKKDRRIYDPKRRDKKMITIPVTRGCFNECTFCFRAYKGLRMHSIKYIFDFIEYCVEKFDVGFFSFGDECFASSKARNWAFIEEYKKRKLDIMFRILGMRVDTVDRDILKSFKEIGCWMIEYGFESGSQKMLNIINKRVSVEQNKEVAIWTKEAGIFTSAAIVLAMPGETTETVDESIDFLKTIDLDFCNYQWTYDLPIPGSHLYEFAKISGAIEDEDKYLMSISKEEVSGAGAFHVNLTDEPDSVVAGWASRLKTETDKEHFRKRYKIPFIAKLVRIFILMKLHYKQKNLTATIIRKLKTMIGPNPNVKNTVGEKIAKFRKKSDIDINKLLEGLAFTGVNPEMSLKRMNDRIKEER